MRKLLTAALAGAAVAGGAVIAGSASAQPYYYGPPASYYDPHRYSYPDRPYDNRYYDNRYYGGSSSNMGVLGSVLGSVLGLNYSPGFYSRVPVDQYGPDPNGMIGPDGRRIKCKLRRSYDRYYGGYVVRRECWTR